MPVNRPSFAARLPRALAVVAATACLTLLSGCALILDGTTEDVEIGSNPQGANCIIKHEEDGLVVARIEETPQTIELDKTKHDLRVECTKQGYGSGVGHMESGVDSATLGNILIGGVIGWGVDSATGADNDYPDRVTVTLTPDVAASGPDPDQAE